MVTTNDTSKWQPFFGTIQIFVKADTVLSVDLWNNCRQAQTYKKSLTRSLRVGQCTLRPQRQGKNGDRTSRFDSMFIPESFAWIIYQIEICQVSYLTRLNESKLYWHTYDKPIWVNESGLTHLKIGMSNCDQWYWTNWPSRVCQMKWPTIISYKSLNWPIFCHEKFCV